MSVYWMLGNSPGQALAHLRKASELQPRASYTRANLGTLYSRSGFAEYAESARLTALEKNRNNPYYLYSEAERHYQQGAYDKALAELKRALWLDDSEHHFHRLMGLVWLKLDQAEDAQDSFTRAAELNVESRYGAMYSHKLQLLAGN